MLLLSSFYSITALVFSLFVMVMYSEKEKYKNHENTVFLVILLFTAVVSVAEIFYAYCLSKFETTNIIVPFSIRMFIVLSIAWMSLAFYYVYCQMSRKYDEEKKRFYKTQLLRKWGSNSLRENRPNLYYPIKGPDGSDVYPMIYQSDKQSVSAQKLEIFGRWRWGASTMSSACSYFPPSISQTIVSSVL